MSEDPSSGVEARLAELEARVAGLEAAGRPDAPAGPVTGGLVTYGGESHLDGKVTWNIRYTPDAILELSVSRTSEVLAALGHPVRLQIVRMLLRGPANAAELQKEVGLGSPGQVYHHLKTLSSANIVEQQARGDYRIGAKKVIPLLVSMLSAGDIAGELGA